VCPAAVASFLFLSSSSSRFFFFSDIFFCALGFGGLGAAAGTVFETRPLTGGRLAGGAGTLFSDILPFLRLESFTLTSAVHSLSPAKYSDISMEFCRIWACTSILMVTVRYVRQWKQGIRRHNLFVTIERRRPARSKPLLFRKILTSRAFSYGASIPTSPDNSDFRLGSC